MRTDNFIYRFILVSGLGSILLASCAGTVQQTEEPIKPQVAEESVLQPMPEPIQEEPAAVTYNLADREELPTAVSRGLQDDDQIIVLEDPWKLVKQANNAPLSMTSGLLLRAVAEFLKRDQISTALSILERLDIFSMSPAENLQATILQGRIALASGRNHAALTLLESIDMSRVTDQKMRVEYLQALSNAQITEGQTSKVVVTLLNLHDLSPDHKRIELQQQILRRLQSMTPLQRSLLSEIAVHQDLTGWVALVDALDMTNPQYLEADFSNWRSVYPDHPALAEALEQSQGWYDLTRYRQVALLLPLSSAFGAAAQAFHDGFMEAQSRDHILLRPQVLLYDIGNEPELSSLYYQAAVNDEADFIVGPLGRQGVTSLLENFSSEIDTLVIADIPDQFYSDHLFAISLSPEDEARQAAEKAWLDGHRQAAVFRIAGQWGQRVAEAFIKQWEMLGGIIVKNNSFPGNISDYSRIIQKYLGLNQSIIRYKLITAQLGVNLKYAPRRNEDMDFLFLAANADQSRLVVPQLRFFRAHDLPIYATSYVYSGKPDPSRDADLNGLIFPDMKWILDSTNLYHKKIEEEKALKIEKEKALKDAATSIAMATAENQAQEYEVTQFPKVVTESVATAEPEIIPPTTGDESESIENDSPAQNFLVSEQESLQLSGPKHIAERRPYQNTDLDRLYALGLQSYRLIPRLAGLRSNSWNRYSGDVMTVSLSEHGEVIRLPVWLTFRDGLPERVLTLP